VVNATDSRQATVILNGGRVAAVAAVALISVRAPKIFLISQKCFLNRGCFAACAQKLFRNQRQHVDWRGRRTRV